MSARTPPLRTVLVKMPSATLAHPAAKAGPLGGGIRRVISVDGVPAEVSDAVLLSRVRQTAFGDIRGVRYRWSDLAGPRGRIVWQIDRQGPRVMRLRSLIIHRISELGWTHQELADRSGTERTRITELLNGQGNPTEARLDALISALGGIEQLRWADPPPAADNGVDTPRDRR